MDKYKIKEISVDTIEYKMELELRDEVLRKPLGLSILNDDLSKEINDIHIGVFEKENIVGCLVVTILNNDEVKLRQVAIMEREQGKGIGRKLIKWTEQYLKDRKYKKILLNARVEAIKFYESMDYLVNGKEFFEIGIPHKKMIKIIKSI